MNALLFDLDDILIVEQPAAVAAFEATARHAAASHELDAARLALAARVRARELLRSAPTYDSQRERLGGLAQDLRGKRSGAQEILAAERQLGEHGRKGAVRTVHGLADLAIDVKLDSEISLGRDFCERQLG